MAIKEKERANQETERANELLKQYEMERGFGNVLINDRFAFLKDLLKVYSDRYIFDDPGNSINKSLSALDVIIKNRNANNWVKNQRAYIYFLSQEFGKAIEDFSGHAMGDPNLIRLARKYAVEHEPGSTLTLEYMSFLLRDLYGLGKEYHGQLLMMMR
ncbi:MAG: hypothetical protein MK132_10330 [Lentisphaerales bacterium]|nr:hypothetical protein [Lentisphaerales bacterium]